MEDTPLFEEPAPQALTLSDHFSTFHYRIVPDSKISYRKRAMRKFHACEECAYLQHETEGTFGPKRAIRCQRVGPGECPKDNPACLGKPKHQAHIDLCNEHKMLWEDRDARDLREHG